MTTLAHPLPEPLRLADGTLVSTPEAWHTRRRPELKASTSTAPRSRIRRECRSTGS